MTTDTDKRAADFEPARILANGICMGPRCCGESMADDGGCSIGCCDDYRCETCGFTTRVEWPD